MPGACCTPVTFVGHPTSPMWRWAWAELPAAELARRGSPARCVTAEQAARGDVAPGSIVVTTLDVPPAVIRQLMDRGPVLVIVNDDLWALDDMGAMAIELGVSPDLIRRGLEIVYPLVEAAAAVLVTAEPLCEIVGRVRPRVCHVPWAAPQERAWPPARARDRAGMQAKTGEAHPPFRIGWVGLPPRERDFAIVREALTRLSRERPGLEFVFWGASPSWVGALGGRAAVYPRALLGPREYFARLRALDLDLAIAPIAATRLNDSRSRAKFIDATVGAGCPLVASDFGPYRRLAAAGAPLVTVPGDGWYAALTLLLDDAERREALTAAARAWTAKHATIEVVGDDWCHAIAMAAA